MALTKTPSADRQAAPTGPQRAGLRLLPRLTTTGTVWLKRRARRAELRRLLRTGPHLIADIGLAPEAARREARKPFWKS